MTRINKDNKGTVKARDGRKIIEAQGWKSIRKEHRMAHPPYVCNVLGLDDLCIKEYEHPMLVEYCDEGHRAEHKERIEKLLKERPWLYDQFLFTIAYYYHGKPKLMKGRKEKTWRKSGWHFEGLLRSTSHENLTYEWQSVDFVMGVRG